MCHLTGNPAWVERMSEIQVGFPQGCPSVGDSLDIGLFNFKLNQKNITHMHVC